jgi:hypothetical protein
MSSSASRAGFASEAGGFGPDLSAEPPKQPDANTASRATTTSENRLIGFLDAEGLGKVPNAVARLFNASRCFATGGGVRAGL